MPEAHGGLSRSHFLADDVPIPQKCSAGGVRGIEIRGTDTDKDTFVIKRSD